MIYLKMRYNITIVSVARHLFEVHFLPPQTPGAVHGRECSFTPTPRRSPSAGDPDRQLRSRASSGHGRSRGGAGGNSFDRMRMRLGSRALLGSRPEARPIRELSSDA